MWIPRDMFGRAIAARTSYPVAHGTLTNCHLPPFGQVDVTANH